ncbi:hypothetical protein ACWEKU_12520 [Streptomyces californicus]
MTTPETPQLPEAVFRCRSCAARRTGQAVSSVVYRPRWQRTLLHGTGNQIAGHAGLRSPALVVASVAVASATVGSGLTLACMKLKGQLEDSKAQHDEAAADGIEETAASTEVVTAEETEAPESPWLRAVSVRRSTGTCCCRSA